jgi:hypothetical protein
MCLSIRGFFWQAIDTIGKTKVATYIAGHNYLDTICEAIENVGSENVVQVVTDNAGRFHDQTSNLSKAMALAS